MHIIAPLAIASIISSSQACLTEHIRSGGTVLGSEKCTGRSISTDNNTFAIANAQVFDGVDFGDPTTVIVSGSRILTVGRHDHPSDLHTVDGSGKFLIPGLIDSHVHPQNCSSLAELAGYGVTTAINMACLNYTVCAQLKGQLGTTDYITSGQIACGNGSVHAIAFAVPDADTVSPGTDLASLVGYTFGNGSDFFKIVAEEKGPTVEQQTIMVQLARSYGSFAATHATLMEYYDQAIRSKVDGIQHMAADGILSSEQVRQIQLQQQFVVPTMQLYRIAFSDAELKSSLGFDSRSNYSNIQTNVANMHRAGVSLAVGTDAVGSIPGVLSYPFGRTLHCELQNLVDAGLTNAEALHAATAGAAKLYRLNDRGSIADGMRADLVLLNSNPATSMANSLDISAVWAAGIRIENITAEKGQSCDPSSPGF